MQKAKIKDDIGFVESVVNDFQTEREVIAYLIHGNMWLDELNTNLSEQTFVHPTYKEIYRAIAAIYARGEQVTPADIMLELKKRHSELTEIDIINIAETIGRSIYYNNPKTKVKHLQELERRRILANMGYALADLAQDEETDLADINARLMEFVNEAPEEERITTLADAGQKVLDRMIENAKYDKPLGTATGFSQLDAVGGLHKGDLVVVAGDTSNGKTSFALSVTFNAIHDGKRIAYYSLEMSSEELMARLLAIKSGVPASTQLYKRAYSEDYDKVYDALQSLPKDNLLFDDRATIDFESILASIRAMKHNCDINGAVVDYMQILNVNNKGRETQEQMMAQVARRLKNLAKELNIWIMVLSQLSRNSQNPEPTLSRLRDSGQIAEAADVVILIYRPELYHKFYSHEFKECTTTNTAQIDVAKGRNIGLMKFIVNFNPLLTHFYEGDITPVTEVEQQREVKTINIDPVTGESADEDLPY